MYVVVGLYGEIVFIIYVMCFVLGLIFVLNNCILKIKMWVVFF